MWTTEVKEMNDGSGDQYIELPLGMFESMGWYESTPLEWVVKDDGTVVLRKVENND